MQEIRPIRKQVERLEDMVFRLCCLLQSAFGNNPDPRWKLWEHQLEEIKALLTSPSPPE